MLPDLALSCREEWRGQQGTKQEDKEVEGSQEAPCRWLWSPVDLRGQQTPRKDGTSGATPPQGNQTTPLPQLSCAQTIAPLYTANSAKVHATAEPTSAQINQHTHAPRDGSHPQHHHRAFAAAGLQLGQGSAHQAHTAQMLQSGEQGCTSQVPTAQCHSAGHSEWLWLAPSLQLLQTMRGRVVVLAASGTSLYFVTCPIHKCNGIR